MQKGKDKKTQGEKLSMPVDKKETVMSIAMNEAIFKALFKAIKRKAEKIK